MNLTLSEQIRLCKDGAAGNPFQGKTKKVLFVCSMGILRSATAAHIYAGKYNTRCAGTYDDALIQLSPILIAWADEIVFVNKENYEAALSKYARNTTLVSKSMVLNISDNYPYMAPELIKELEEQYEPVDHS
jgi:predicted protein tyrosine phosphatase